MPVLPRRRDEIGEAVQKLKRRELFGDAGVPTIVATFADSAGDFTVIATHPVPPKGPEYARDRGVQTTWNARAWAPRIPIDHVLVPPGTAVLRRGVGPDVGSDHFPVEAAIRLPAGR